MEYKAKTIRPHLWNLHNKQATEFYWDRSSGTKDIFENFSLYKDRIVIFHYGGHASGQILRLEGKNADAAGLTHLFTDQKQLKLVFLFSLMSYDKLCSDYFITIHNPSAKISV